MTFTFQGDTGTFGFHVQSQNTANSRFSIAIYDREGVVIEESFDHTSVVDALQWAVAEVVK